MLIHFHCLWYARCGSSVCTKDRGSHQPYLTLRRGYDVLYFS